MLQAVKGDLKCVTRSGQTCTMSPHESGLVLLLLHQATTIRFFFTQVVHHRILPCSRMFFACWLLTHRRPTGHTMHCITAAHRVLMHYQPGADATLCLCIRVCVYSPVVHSLLCCETWHVPSTGQGKTGSRQQAPCSLLQVATATQQWLGYSMTSAAIWCAGKNFLLVERAGHILTKLAVILQPCTAWQSAPGISQ